MTSYFGTPSSEDWPGASEGTARMKDREATAAGWWLRWAAIGCIIRAAAAPWYVRYFGDPMSRTQPDNVSIVQSSLICLAIFGITSVVARFRPILSCLVAMIGFGVVSWFDLHQTPDLFEAGIISKLLFLGITVWAMMNAVFSKVM